MTARAATVRAVVLDTNIVLDVFVFNDSAADSVRKALVSRHVDWLATPAMRVELERVLTYPKIALRLAFYRLSADDVLAKFDEHAHLVAVAPKAGVTCSDPDDQIFIDLAVQHQCPLLSKDRAVVSLKKRLLAHGVQTHIAI